MNTARIVVLTIAVGAGGLAAYLASGSDRKPQPAAVAQMKTVDVLVAKTDIPLGKTVTASDLQWQTWPASAASATFVRRDSQPDAPTKLANAIVRSPFVAGEPIRDSKLVMAGSSGFMAAVLPAGMRAISTEISPETGAGGFILPNDRVDVILSRREKNPDQNNGEAAISETILTNVRVLAIDQTPREKEGQNAVIGKTATLELKPEQAETLARARQTGTLSLALRSLADANTPVASNDDPGRRESINVVRYGVSTKATTRQ
jgi:pilus assembly protein CpaB